MSSDSPDPLLVYRNPETGKLAIKVAKKGAKWRGQFKDLNDAVKDASKDMTAPYPIVFVKEQ